MCVYIYIHIYTYISSPSLRSFIWTFSTRALAFTRYSFTCFCVCKNQSHPFITPPISHYPRYYNTSVQLLRNI